MVTVWWLYGASLYGDCMEPGRDMNPTFYVLTPLQFWGCFWTRLGILRSPMWFLSRKLKYWRNYRGGKFCFVLIRATIATYSRTTLAATKLQDTITLWFFGIIENQTHRRKQDIQTLPNLVSDLAGGHYKKYRFFLYSILVSSRYRLNSTFWDLPASP